MRLQPRLGYQAGEGPGAGAAVLYRRADAAPGDVDRFKFSAKKGEVYDFTSYSRFTRSPIDTVVDLFDQRILFKNNALHFALCLDAP